MLLLLACAPATDDTALPSACGDTPVGEVSLPADDTVHEERVEWWYWTGHLFDDAGRRYGFEQVFFLFDFGADTRHRLGNTALTDVDGDRFVYDAAYETDYTPEVVPDGFAFEMDGWSAEGGDGHDTLVGSAEDASWSLALDTAKAPVLQHGDGYTDYDFGGYTWYYSRPRMDVSGTVTTSGGEVAVTGSAWFDHQWGELLQASAIGWDWFALQLDDGRDIMVFLVRDGDSPTMVGGSVTDAGCHTTELTTVDVTSTDSWTSDTTACTWPSGWTVTVGDETFTLTPSVLDQELYSEEDTYWEGEVVVSGSATGFGYVELTGYCG